MKSSSIRPPRVFGVYGEFPPQAECRSRVGGPGDAYEPSISRSGNQLAYQVWKQWGTIWRLDLKDERHALAPPVRLLSGRGFIWKPSYSPDGKKIAFESNRMGYSDIWMCDSDGSNCSQLTDRHGTIGNCPLVSEWPLPLPLNP